MSDLDPADEPWADELGEQLSRLQRVRERTKAQISAMAHDQLDVAVYTALWRLAADGPMRASALAEALYSDPSSVSRQVAQLVEKGLVRREADPVDGRASILVVTDAGNEVAETMRRRRNENLGRVIADWTEDDRARFVALLDRFVDGYERRRPDMLAALRARLDPQNAAGDRGGSA